MESTDALTMTPEQAAARLGVGRGTVYKLLHRGELPAVRIGRNYRVIAAALPDLLQVLSARRSRRAIVGQRRGPNARLRPR